MHNAHRKSQAYEHMKLISCGILNYCDYNENASKLSIGEKHKKHVVILPGVMKILAP